MKKKYLDIKHPLDQEDLRSVLLGYSHLPSYWKTDLHWAYAEKYLESLIKNGADNRVLVAAGLAPLNFMFNFCDEVNYLEKFEEPFLVEIWDSWEEYREFHGDQLTKDVLPIPSVSDIKDYLIRLTLWLRAYKVPVEFTDLRHVCEVVYDDENVVLAKI